MACPLLTLQIASLVVVEETIVLHSIAPPCTCLKEDLLLIFPLSWDEIFSWPFVAVQLFGTKSSPYLVRRDFYVADRRGATAFPYTTKELTAPVPAH